MLDTPGAFVAVQDEEGLYRLFRILQVLVFESGERVIFATVYEPRARDLAEAERLAREPMLPLLNELTVVQERDFTSRPWKIVWFRTLTDAELDVIR